MIAKETAEFEQLHAADLEDSRAGVHTATEQRQAPATNSSPGQPSDEPPGSSDTVGVNINPEQVTEAPKHTATTNDTSFPSPPHHGQTSIAPKGHEDDSGEVVVEDTEDTVIY